MIIIDNELYYGGTRKWIADKTQQTSIIYACHSDKLGGHFGRDKTREKIATRFVDSKRHTLALGIEIISIKLSRPFDLSSSLH